MPAVRLVAYRELTACNIPNGFGARVQRHLETISHPERRSASLCAWDLLYNVLTERGLEEYARQIGFTERGKPYFENGDLHFSISHSGVMCAVSLADVPTGIDVEHVRRDYGTSLVEKSMTDGERAVYDGDFTRLWCRKESLAKLTGRGVVGHPSRIDTMDRAVSFFECELKGKDCHYRLAAAFLGNNGPVTLLKR